jgi:hypothetical protein
VSQFLALSRSLQRCNEYDSFPGVQRTRHQMPLMFLAWPMSEFWETVTPLPLWASGPSRSRPPRPQGLLGSLRGTGTFSNAGAVGLDQLSCAERKRQGHTGVAIAQPPQTVGRGHEALRISRKRDRLARPHCDTRRVTPPG